MKLKLVTALFVLIATFSTSQKVVLAQNWLNWVWSDYSNSSLLTETGDFTKSWWWWFRPEKRPATAYILLNHASYGLPTYNGCAFNPNGKLGKKFTVVKRGITFEYFLYENVGIVAPVGVRGGTVVAQTKGPRMTGGSGICGIRYFLPKTPVKVNLPF
jgi:hypothetical protein